MKKTDLSRISIAASLLLFILSMGFSSFAYAKNDNHKVTICHATSSETNPYNTIVVSINAIGGHFDNPGTPKAGHEDDLFFDYETTCPGGVVPSVSPTQGEASPTPTDIPVPTITIPFPTEAEIPVATPTPGNGSINLSPTPTRVVEVVPTSTPSATIAPTSAPVGGGSNDTATVSGTSSSSSSNSTSGQVLGASTASLPNTGEFYDVLSLLMMGSGGMLMAVSLSSYAKATKKN